MKRQQIRTRTAAVVLAALAIAAFWPAGGGGFQIYDDTGYVTDNPVVLDGLTLRGVGWAFTTSAEANWHPLTWLSHMADVQLFGLNPLYHHAVSILLQIAAAVLLYLALVRMTHAPARSLFVAALFAVHPLQVESVAWIAERKDVLAGLLGMLTLLAYARYVERPGPRRYAAVCAGLALGLMAKPSVVVIPVLLLFLDYWPLGRFSAPGSWRKPVAEKLPLLGLALASAVVTFAVQKAGGAMDYAAANLPLEARLGNAAVSVVRYLGKAFWPSGLAVLYPHPGAPSLVPLAAALALIALVTVAVLRVRHAAPYLVTGWFWFLAALVPALGIVQVGLQAMADRYMHLPIIGLGIACAWGLADLGTRMKFSSTARALVASGVIASCCAAAAVQAAYWKNGVTLFQRAVDVTENNWVAHNNLGVALAGSMRFREARAHYREALRINPAYTEASLSLAYSLADDGQLDSADAVLRRALMRAPQDPHLPEALGELLEQRGRPAEAADAYGRSLAADTSRRDMLYALARTSADAGRLAAAESLCREFLRRVPDSSEAHDLLGTIYAEQGKFGAARGEFAEAARLDAANGAALCNAGILYDREGKPDSAEICYRGALERDSTLWNAHRGLGALCARRGDVPGAIRHFAAAVALNPAYADGHNNLGKLFELEGRNDSAAAHFTAALAADPGHTQAHYNMGMLLARAGDRARAAEHLRAALARNPDLKDARDVLRRLGEQP